MTDTIHFSSQGQTISAELYRPASAAATGVIVIAYGSDGLTDDLTGPWATMIRGYADALAKSGFIIVVPDYLAVTKTQPGAEVFVLIPTCRDLWQGALSDAIDHATTLTGVDATRVGLLGFSLGGHLCLRVRGKAKVLVEFFAPVLDGIVYSVKLTRAEIHHGEADNLPGTGFQNAQSIERTLKTEGTPTELHGYPGAGHGFIGEDKENKEARELSKKRTIAFFGANL